MNENCIEPVVSETKPCIAGITAPPIMDITMIAPAVSVYFFYTDFKVSA